MPNRHSSAFVSAAAVLIGCLTASGCATLQAPKWPWSKKDAAAATEANLEQQLGEDADSALNRAAFRLPDATSSDIVRVFWGWSDNGIWKAPKNPRLVFRGQPYLFKLYVVDRSLQQADDVKQAETFLEQALPVIRKGLHP